MMRENVIRDYFRAFRWSKIKPVLMKGGFWFIYMGVILPFVSGFVEKVEYFVVFQLMFLPLSFTFFSASLHRMELPKAMFLCPLSEQERRDYVVQSCIFRICLTSIVGLLFTIGLVASGLCDMVSGITMLCNHVFMSLMLCGFDGRKGRTEEERNRALLQEADANSGVKITTVILIALCCFGVACMLCWDTTPAEWVKWMFLAVALLVELPLTVYVMKGWRPAVEKAISYEASNV